MIIRPADYATGFASREHGLDGIWISDLASFVKSVPGMTSDQDAGHFKRRLSMIY
jgi:hypothetical protein